MELCVAQTFSNQAVSILILSEKNQKFAACDRFFA